MYPSGPGTATRRTPRMDRQKERILSIIQHGPMTSEDVANALYCNQRTASYYLRLLCGEKKAYVSAWLPVPGNRPTKMYSPGDCKDVRYIKKRNVRKPNRADTQKERVFELLALPRTSEQVAEAAEISISVARTHLARLRKEQRIYIKAWLLPDFKGSQTRIYAIGNEPDAIRVRRTRQYARRAEKRHGKKPVQGIFAALGL